MSGYMGGLMTTRSGDWGWTAPLMQGRPFVCAMLIFCCVLPLSGRCTGSVDAAIETFRHHTEKVKCVAFSPDSQIVASGSVDDTAVLWDTMTRKKRQILRHSRTVHALAFSPDGKMVATGSTGHLEEERPCALIDLWNPGTGEKIASLRSGFLTNPVLSLAFSPDGKTLAAGCSAGPEREKHRGQVLLYDVASKRLGARLLVSSGAVFGLAFSPDGNTLAGAIYATVTGEVIVWDVATRKVRYRLERPSGSVFSV